MGRHAIDKPTDKPTIHAIRMKADFDEKKSIDSLVEAVKSKFLLGYIVVGWCTSCKRWKFNFVSREMVDQIFPSSTFPCTACKTKIPLILDEFHTIMENA